MPVSIETLTTIEQFNKTVNRAIQARSKDVRISIDIAMALVAELSNVMARLAVLETSVATATASLYEEVKSHKFDGGRF